MKPRKTNSNGTSKAKPAAEASLLEQLGMPLRDFVADFKLHGKSALEQVRQESPSKYLELSTKLAGLVAMLKPESDGISKAKTMQEIAVALLKSVGLEDESSITPDMIAQAVAANDAFIAKLEAIRDGTSQDLYKGYLAIRSGDDSMAMPRQLARGLQAKRHSRRREQRPLAECLPHINVNDLPIPRDYQIHVAPNISLRYPYIAGMRIAYDGVEFTHTGRTQIFDFKWIKTGFGYPRPAFICDCGRPVLRLYFRYLNLACRRCCSAIYGSQACDKNTRPILQALRLQTFLRLKTYMRQHNRRRLQARIPIAQNKPLNSKRLNHHILPHSNYGTRGAMHWR